MKTFCKNLLMLSLAVTPLSAAAQGQSEAGGGDTFSVQLTTAIQAYEGTAAPLLPKLENAKEIEREFSTTPGRMHVPRRIIVNKDACRLVLVNAFGDTLHTNYVCSSRNRGQKRVTGDCRTPEGTFSLYGVYESSEWTYKDTGSKCYGLYFLSLKTPVYCGVGIHGTNAPGSIPGRSSHGCIRVLNENIVILKSMVNKDTRVTVLPDKGVPDTPPAAASKPKDKAREEKKADGETPTKAAESSSAESGASEAPAAEKPHEPQKPSKHETPPEN